MGGSWKDDVLASGHNNCVDLNAKFQLKNHRSENTHTTDNKKHF